MAKKTAGPIKIEMRTLDARPDTVDFRDRMYEATLVEVPTHVPLAAYQRCGVPILDQGVEGACTGFGLATVANYLLRCRKVEPDETAASPRMFYEMARRYDEWPGEDYEGSSARGAMKGWHKHGVCSDTNWPYTPQRPGTLTDERAGDAANRPLGAYYRVNHKDLVCLHAAIAEVGILYATGIVHDGWDEIDADGHIPLPANAKALGGHAFAVVAYDRDGIWIQNSWGPRWGFGGFGHITYDDWLEHGSDMWVARLGVPLTLGTARAVASTRAAGATACDGYSFHDLRPHIVTLGNNGELRETGTYSTPAPQLKEILETDFVDITAGWKKRRLLLYAHGGLMAEESAVQRVADYRAALLKQEVFPLAFIWKTDLWSTLRNILENALAQRRPEAFIARTRDFMLDRLDDAIEPLARQLSGKAIWGELKENAVAATVGKQGGVRLALQHVANLAAELKNLEIHVVGHSAGAILLGPLVQLLTTKGKISKGPLNRSKGLGLGVASCTLWAPSCTTDFFKQTYLPAIENGAIDRFALFTLTDEAERDDDCANIYHKSLLYLISHALDTRPRIPLFQDGEPILGMMKSVRDDKDIARLLAKKKHRWVLAPNALPDSAPDASRAKTHGEFDDDPATLRATLAHVLHETKDRSQFVINRSASFFRGRRRELSAVGASTNGIHDYQ